MATSSRRASLLALAITIAIAGCSTMPPPHGTWVPDLSSATSQVAGGTILIEYRVDKADRQAFGELIAVESNDVLVLNGKHLSAIPLDQIRHYELSYVDPSRGRMGVSGSRPGDSVRPCARFPQGLADREAFERGLAGQATGPADTRKTPAPADTLTK